MTSQDPQIKNKKSARRIMTIFSDSNILKNANPLPDLVCLMSGFLLHVRGNYQL